ncbi:hypothetical protein HDV04_006226 [Boothiomyces sp. JEL0838]|nr:hypothetical protein HDV04_006226 [Boothiomyces sp. JEL0838]
MKIANVSTALLIASGLSKTPSKRNVGLSIRTDTVQPSIPLKDSPKSPKTNLDLSQSTAGNEVDDHHDPHSFEIPNPQLEVSNSDDTEEHGNRAVPQIPKATPNLPPMSTPTAKVIFVPANIPIVTTLLTPTSSPLPSLLPPPMNSQNAIKETPTKAVPIAVPQVTTVKEKPAPSRLPEGRITVPSNGQAKPPAQNDDEGLHDEREEKLQTTSSGTQVISKSEENEAAHSSSQSNSTSHSVSPLLIVGCSIGALFVVVGALVARNNVKRTKMTEIIPVEPPVSKHDSFVEVVSENGDVM